MHITWPKQFKPWEVAVVVGCIIVVGALIYCALLHSLCDLKVEQMNMKCNLIQKFILYKFQLVHNTTEMTKNICCVKGEGKVDHSTVNRGLKKFRSSSKNIDDQAK